MSHQPDRDSVLFLSKREGTGTGHFTSYSGTVGIGVEQLEQVTFPPIRSCSRCWNRSMESGPFFEVFFDRAIPTTLEQVKSGLNSRAKTPISWPTRCSRHGKGGPQEVGRIITKYVNYDSLTINKLSHLLKNGIVISTYAGFHPILPLFLASFMPTTSQMRPLLRGSVPMPIYEDYAR
jgi:hypothetical protein